LPSRARRRATRSASYGSANGNALRSLEQFKGTLVHATWYFARVKDAFPSKATTAKAKQHRFKDHGHQHARS
jgi:hypothetical protein